MSERFRKVATLAAIGVASYTLTNSAFTRRSREKILRRDGRRCVRCGSTKNLHAAHIDHDRDNPRYDDPSNGRTLCQEHHHEDHQKRHGRNGLHPKANRWAIDRLNE